MIRILIPGNNIQEREYIIGILFGEFLGVNYSVEITNIQSYELVLVNGNKLTIEDHFFNRFPSELEYLKEENIPKSVEFVNHAFAAETDIPVLFGNSSFIIHPSSFTCGIDIFASSFFMLTRWEEYVIKARDEHNRFPALASLAYKHNFLDRPVVNEYVELLWNMLVHLGYKDKRKERKFEFILTHDVDVLRRYKSASKVIKEAGGDIIKRRSPGQGIGKLIEYGKILAGIEKDPFDTFDYLMHISEKANVKSYFFFMATGQTKFDNQYKLTNKLTQNIIKNIQHRGHYIGIHPTYNAYSDPKQFKKELKELERAANQKIAFGREHYLRFEMPTTWQIWEDNGLEWDSTLSYADKEGFRCGVCYEYSVFNLLTGQKLSLKEKPLIVMEGSFGTYQTGIEAVMMEKKIKELIAKVKKYKGSFVFLWHNSSFNHTIWKEYQHIYNHTLFLSA